MTGPPKTLTDGKITLCIYSIDDADAHFHGEDDEMRRRFPSNDIPTLESTKAAIARAIARHESGGRYAYAIKLPTRSLAGGCEFRVTGERTAHISYWIFPPFRRKGYATKAVGLLCRAATIFGIRCLEAHIGEDNHASLRLAARAGFVSRGLVKDEPDADGVIRERTRWELALPAGTSDQRY